MLLIPRWKIPRRSLYMFHSPLSSNIIQIYIYICHLFQWNGSPKLHYTAHGTYLQEPKLALPSPTTQGTEAISVLQLHMFSKDEVAMVLVSDLYIIYIYIYIYIHTYTCIYTCIYYGLSRVLGAITSGFRFHARWRRLTNLQMMGRQGHTSHALHPCKVSPNIYIYIYVIKTYWKHPVSYLFLI